MTTLAHFFPLLAYGYVFAFLLFFLLWMVQVVIKDAGVRTPPSPRRSVAPRSPG